MYKVELHQNPNKDGVYVTERNQYGVTTWHRTSVDGFIWVARNQAFYQNLDDCGDIEDFDAACEILKHGLQSFSALTYSEFVDKFDPTNFDYLRHSGLLSKVDRPLDNLGWIEVIELDDQ